MIPKALKARKNMAASLIQRYVKGYIGWRGINRNFDSEKRHHFTPKQTRSHAAANHSFYANPLPKLANNPMVHF